MPTTDPVEGEDPNSLKNRLARWLGIHIIFAGTHVRSYHPPLGRLLLTKSLAGHVCRRQDISCESDAPATDRSARAKDPLGRDETGAFWIPAVNTGGIEAHKAYVSLTFQ
jgi:hypothetical protein